MARGCLTPQAHHSVIDPLIEPEPSQETGLNSHFGSTYAPRQNPTPPHSAGFKSAPSASIRPQHTGSTVETNPFRRSKASSVSSKTGTLVDFGATTPRKQQHGYPSPPSSASPRREHFRDHRAEAFGGMSEGRPRRSSNPVRSENPFQESKGLSRGSSLRERYPGDTSHRPLDVIRKDTKTAHRTHHLRKKNFTGADTIDRLDRSTFGMYHHEGPYDAANLSRNKDWKHSPVAAVADSNNEALRATPRENIVDAVTKHRPLEGVANLPPGVPDRFGRVLNYEEGADLQREPGGDYKRWPGVEYLPGDLKGKGEPSYSIEKALKDHKQYGDEGIEMTTRRRNQSLSAADAPPPEAAQSSAWDDGNAPIGRSNTTGRNMGESLKKRFGSMRRRRAAS
ncbi:hypothetical protein K491DRAFT_612119 [Lophiostoma macrostomum CBS 122681]|uniref:Pal1-domain-containing protein n=1 Tax=Lophiostoma macrostomum CBS 122681 TaxID=1314788 RepID=A0A6A6SP55_9PLEO|nr:hypothetical protein K491DRAFT_612119 [Lophiostoma macrostomum CBS 122681]